MARWPALKWPAGACGSGPSALARHPWSCAGHVVWRGSPGCSGKAEPSPLVGSVRARSLPRDRAAPRHGIRRNRVDRCAVIPTAPQPEKGLRAGSADSQRGLPKSLTRLALTERRRGLLTRDVDTGHVRGRDSNPAWAGATRRLPSATRSPGHGPHSPISPRVGLALASSVLGASASHIVPGFRRAWPRAGPYFTCRTSQPVPVQRPMMPPVGTGSASLTPPPRRAA